MLRLALLLVAISVAVPAHASESALALPDDWCAERPELHQFLPPGDVTLHSENWNLTYGVEHECEVHMAVKDIDDALDVIIAGAKKLHIQLRLDEHGTIRGHTKDLEVYVRPQKVLGEVHLSFTLKHAAADSAKASAFAKRAPELAQVMAQLPAGTSLRRAEVSYELDAPVRSQLTLTLAQANRGQAEAWLKKLGLTQDKTGLYRSSEPGRTAASMSDDMHARKHLEMTIWFNPL